MASRTYDSKALPTPNKDKNPILAEGIEIGDDDDDTYQSSINGSDTTSISSSVMNYVYENGRRYASDRFGADFVIPNDDMEQERLDLLHHLLNLVMGGELHLAPVECPKKALDIGTGTGIWALDFADKYPDCEVIGTDVSPIQPSFVSPNCRFEIDNFEEEWTFENNEFDLVHMRFMSGSVKDWKDLFRKALHCTAPGGYVEVVEFDITGGYSFDKSFEGTAAEKYLAKLTEAGKVLGTRFDLIPTLKETITKAGFTEVTEKKFFVPIGTWPKDHQYKEIGAIASKTSFDGTEAYGLALLTRVLGMDTAEAKALCKNASQDFINRKIHTVMNLHVIYGKKPEKRRH